MVKNKCWYCDVYPAYTKIGLCKKCDGVGVLPNKAMQRLEVANKIISDIEASTKRAATYSPKQLLYKMQIIHQLSLNYVLKYNPPAPPSSED